MGRPKIIDILQRGETPPIPEKPKENNEDLFGFPEQVREPQVPSVRKLKVVQANELLERPKTYNYPIGVHNRKGQRQYLWELQKGLCLFCDQPFNAQRLPTLDHIIARSKGGSDAIENKCLVCGPCNSLKGNFTSFTEAAEWAATIAQESYRREKDALRILAFFKKLRDRGIIK